MLHAVRDRPVVAAPDGTPVDAAHHTTNDAADHTTDNATDHTTNDTTDEHPGSAGLGDLGATGALTGSTSGRSG